MAESSSSEGTVIALKVTRSESEPEEESYAQSVES